MSENIYPSPSDIERVKDAFAKYYRQKAQKLDAENHALWNIAIELCTSILQSSSDGSGITDLQEVAKVQADRLLALLTVASS